MDIVHDLNLLTLTITPKKLGLCVLIVNKNSISYINNVKYPYIMTDNVFDDAAKKMKNASQDAEAEAKTAQDHADGKPSSETMNKAKVKIRDALD